MTDQDRQAALRRHLTSERRLLASLEENYNSFIIDYRRRRDVLYESIKIAEGQIEREEAWQA